MKVIYFLTILGLFSSNFYSIAQANQTSQVLVVHAYSQEYPWTKSQHQGFVDQIIEKSLIPVSISTEYLDSKRRAYNSEYAEQFSQYMEKKYFEYIPDIIYVTDDNGYLFARDYLLNLYPDTSFIFSGVNDYDIISEIETLPIRGVFEKKEISKNLDLINILDREKSEIIILGDGSNTYSAIEAEIKQQLVNYPNINATFIVNNNIDELIEDLRNRDQRYLFLTTIGGIKSSTGKVLNPKEIISEVVNAGNFAVVTMEDAYFFDGVLGGFVTGGKEQGEGAARLALSLIKGTNIQQLNNVTESPNLYIFDQSQLNKLKITLPDQVREKTIFHNVPPTFYARNYTLIVSILILLSVILITLTSSIIISRRNKKEEKRRREEKRTAQIEIYQNAMLEWSGISHKNIDEAFNKATEISSRTLAVKRVSIWLYDESKTAIECRSMYVDGEGHSSGGTLYKSDFPRYFSAVETGRRLAIINVRTDPVTSELAESYLIPNHIFSMLDAPIFYDGNIVGVVCHEHTGNFRDWTINEQEFSSLIASDISLSLEIDKRKAIEKGLEHQAYHDSLTGLPNRALFLDRIEQEIRHASRNKSFLAVLFLDLDKFKQINDSLGHAAGDTVLISIAKNLTSTLREVDTVARLGGDEFTILLTNCNKLDDINDIALKLSRAIQQPLTIENNELIVTTSIGISVYPDDGTSSEILLRNADAAMYRAKEKGRNVVEFYTEDMTAQALEKVLMIANLKRAMEQDEFDVYYQPQYDIEKKQLIGLEALVRWQHPELGLLSPARFLPEAEESGLIVALDRWVMSKSLHQMKAWKDDGIELGRLSLNLTMQQIDQSDFLEFLKKLMKDTGCNGKSLTFEVTEGQLMRDPEKTIELLDRISALDIKISVDDFGTGYSSLVYLKKLPVDVLKIDKEFIRDIPGSEDDVSIVKSIIALAKNMRIDVLAEGVETDDQVVFLKREGCGLVQGYHLSRPKPASEIPESVNYPLD
ncbi:MAG: EAL domain-containing protein [Gammaproteobacteria bacterium]|nr:EAL domain-containing protein [Gammaproteobacteria bacterium]